MENSNSTLCNLNNFVECPFGRDAFDSNSTLCNLNIGK